MASLSTVTRVLARRNMRIYYGGSLAAWTGLWVQRVAVDWLAWQITHSPAWVGILAFCNLAPSVIVSPYAGAVADRSDRVRVAVLAQYVSVAHALTLALLIVTGAIRAEYIALAEIVVGSAQAFAQPARQALVPGMVGKADLPGAVALNSLTYNLARSIGPAIGGLVVSVGGVVPAILINACAYTFASTTLPRLQIDPAVRRGHAPTGSVLREIAEGLAYVARHPGMGPLFLFATAAAVLVRPLQETLAPYIDVLFHQDARGLAMVSSVIGLAAMAGGIAVAVRGRLAGLTAISVGAGLMIAVGTAGFVAVGSFPLALVCAALLGAATTIHGISAQTLLQTASSGHMLGRTLSLWGMIGRAAPALGAMLYGFGGEAFGLRAPVLAAAALAVLCGIPVLRRLPAMARALEQDRNLG